MMEGYSYIAVKGYSRFQKRENIRVRVDATKREKPEVNRTFVPFNGFDGQSLAGTGALVFEGELLETKN
ncbi:MAG: hypothetical protein AAF478_05820 [Pseudomonadota bacterium]